MKSFKYTLTDPVGLHARPAGDLVRKIKTFDSDCTIQGNGKTVDGKKLLEVMTLGIKEGQEVEIAFNGPDEEAAANETAEFMKENL